MCMWVIVILPELQPFELSNFEQFLHYRVWSLCNQVPSQFSMDASQTLQTYFGHIENMYVQFC